MALLDLTPSRPEPLLSRIAAWFATRSAPASAESAEDARARRAFVQEMLERNPQAFGCAEDVQGMMGHFPDRF